MVCEYLEEETAAAVAHAGFSDVSVITFPGRCSPPYSSWVPLIEAIHDIQWHCGNVLILGGQCTSRLEAIPEGLENCRLLALDSCSQALAGPTLLKEHLQDGDLVVTPGELQCIWDHLEKDSPDRAVEEYLSPATSRLVLVDSGMCPEAAEQLSELAGRVQLPCTVVKVGLDYYELVLERHVMEWRLQHERSGSRAALSDAIRRSTDHATALDLISNLTQMMTETEAIDQILDLFTILFAPNTLIYLPLVDGRPGHIRSNPESIAFRDDIVRRLTDFRKDYAWNEAKKGFLLRIARQEETLGVLEIEGIAFPEHREHYLRLSLVVARVCGLAIANARAYEKRREAEEMIRHQAFHDTLTGLPNRMLFHTRLTQALDEAQRSRQNLAVLFLDLDHFKEVNDTLGHDKGDELLRNLAERLKSVLRTDDTVARLGGDEFLVLLPGIASPEDAAKVAERTLQVIQAPFVLEGERAHVTSSIGIAIYPQDGQKAETLIKNADAAMYEAKESSPGGYEFFSEKLRELYPNRRRSAPPVESESTDQPEQT
jgi:diguanylate cyclase (GGDEF)-like protein